MRILLAARSFDQMAGGVERIAISILNEMAKRGHKVYLFTWDYEGAKTFYPLSESVRWYKINLGDPCGKADFYTRLVRAGKIRRIVSEASPDLILAFQHGIFLALKIYTLGMGVPIVAAERNALSRFEFTNAGKNRWWVLPSFLLADQITVQLPGYIDDYPGYLHNKIKVIPNRVEQIDPKKLSPHNSENSMRKVLLSVGRLSFQKNYILLVDCFSELAHIFPDWDLVIAGDGEERGRLLDKISTYKLQDRVTMLGAVEDVASLYLSSDIFCLPSLWEGFPNSLAEALSYGLPSVGFAESAGVSDLIQDGVNGILADGNSNRETLLKSLQNLMQDSNLRAEMSIAAIESVKQYEPENIFDQWERLFAEISSD